MKGRKIELIANHREQEKKKEEVRLKYNNQELAVMAKTTEKYMKNIIRITINYNKIKKLTDNSSNTYAIK